MALYLNRSLLAGLSAIALVACGNANGDNSTATPTSSDTVVEIATLGHVKGNADAPHTLIEYASPTCSHCKHFHEEMGPAIEEEFIATGKIKFVYREFPLNQIDVAAYAVANCLGTDEKFFALLDDLFENQQGIMSAAREGAVKQALLTMAQKHGMKDEAELDACLANREVLEKISDTMMSGEAFNVNSTPTFILDDEVFSLTGAVRTGDDFVNLLNEKLGIEADAESTPVDETPAEDAEAEVDDASAEPVTEAAE